MLVFGAKKPVFYTQIQIMRRYIIYILLIGLFMGCAQSGPKNEAAERENSFIYEETPIFEFLNFPSSDGLIISANRYHLNDTAPVIVLCHQARFNKFSYDGIAPKLVKMGFNCLAIDQRSGGPISSQQNETKNRAVEKGLPTSYLDAEVDIIAAVDFAAKKYNKAVILWGSSYSATLALYAALDNPNIMAVVSFSPGNYFKDEKGSLTDLLVGFEKPFFLTSSQNEATGVGELLSHMTANQNQIHFVPQGSGHHGSRALWENQDGGQEYWKAIGSFLNRIKNN